MSFHPKRLGGSVATSYNPMRRERLTRPSKANRTAGIAGWIRALTSKRSYIIYKYHIDITPISGFGPRSHASLPYSLVTHFFMKPANCSLLTHEPYAKTVVNVVYRRQ